MPAATTRRVVVIGAGVAGLACAARLAAQGLHVTVIEKNQFAGGKLGLLKDQGYSWDTGPSLFTQPYLLEDLFRQCGRKLSDYLSYKALSYGTQYFWEDGSAFHAAPDRKQLLANATEAFGTVGKNLSAYLEHAAKAYESIGSIFLDQPIQRLKAWQPGPVLKALSVLRMPYLSKTLHQYNHQQLKHPRLVQVMDRLATYNGSDPYQCPAMLSMIAHLEFNEGCWYPEGGMIRIPQALRSLCEDLGVTFRAGVNASRITLREGRVAGVRTGEEELPVEAVVSNADVFYTYRDLLKDERQAADLATQERSSSGLIFYWGVKASFPQLRLHNIFFGEDYPGEFRAIFKEGSVPKDPTVYVNITAREDKDHAPAGCENWFVLINVPAREVPLTEEEITAARRAIIQKVSRILHCDLEKLIACEHRLSPADIAAKTGAYRGALYGTSSNERMAAFNRHPNFSRKYKGLFFAGGTVHPGGGVPLCLRSAKLAADETLTFLQAFPR